MIYFSICTRKDKQPKSLSNLLNWISKDNSIDYSLSYDSKSIYEGHKYNIDQFKSFKGGLTDDDIIVLCHDDLDILSTQDQVKEYLQIARQPKTGFVGLCGASHYNVDGAWWNARNSGEARGFCFQGNDIQTMKPNYFGRSGQVIILDGIFLAITYKKLKEIGMDQPKYLSSGWDFYDVHMTFTSHQLGYNNYTVPILAMHESDGRMREGWFKAKEEFMMFHKREVPCKIPYNLTHGLPVETGENTWSI
jgi:hypothetical protein